MRLVLRLDLWRLRLISFGGYGLALAALALVVFGAYDSYPKSLTLRSTFRSGATVKSEHLFCGVLTFGCGRF